VVERDVAAELGVRGRYTDYHWVRVSLPSEIEEKRVARSGAAAPVAGAVGVLRAALQRRQASSLANSRFTRA